MKLIPANHYVILKPITEQTTDSSLYIPPKEGGKQEMGEIYLIGKGKQPFDVEMEAGDICIYEKYMDNTMTIPETQEVINPVAFKYLTVLIKKDGK